VLCIRASGFVNTPGFIQDEGSSFSSKGGITKPAEISYWQKAHRPWKDQPLRNKTLAQFLVDWWAWWKSLQPATRISDAGCDLVAPSVGMDWSSLRKSGRNGFLLVMLSLTWWGKFSALDEKWRLAVADVTAALRCLCDSHKPPSTTTPNPRKRKPDVLGSSSHANTASSRKKHKPAKGDTRAQPPVNNPSESRQLRNRCHK
jgi:hypothetical protein